MILGARIVRQLLAGSRIFLQTPTGRTLAQIRALSINTIVGTLMFPFVLALVDILADAFFTRISRRTDAIIIFLRICTLIPDDDGDTCMIILSKFESCRTGT